VSRAYPPATFEAPQAALGFGAATWFRVFRCPACQAVLGRQRIRVTYGPDEEGIGVRPIGHTIQRVELVQGLVLLGPDEDGLLRFGLPRRAYLAPTSPSGARRRSALRRATSVLPSVEGGDPYHVARHDPRRARDADSDFVLALEGTDAVLPFVVTCPNPLCERHWLVGGAPSAAELSAATGPATPL
jgi:hypothetical protein